jgi:hypothetical protein
MVYVVEGVKSSTPLRCKLNLITKGENLDGVKDRWAIAHVYIIIFFHERGWARIWLREKQYDYYKPDRSY